MINIFQDLLTMVKPPEFWRGREGGCKKEETYGPRANRPAKVCLEGREERKQTNGQQNKKEDKGLWPDFEPPLRRVDHTKKFRLGSTCMDQRQRVLNLFHEFESYANASDSVPPLSGSDADRFVLPSYHRRVSPAQ